jgi:hypothetical protein
VYAVLSFGCGPISRSFTASISTWQLEMGWCSLAKLRTWHSSIASGEATFRRHRSQSSSCECFPSLGMTGSSHLCIQAKQPALDEHGLRRTTGCSCRASSLRIPRHLRRTALVHDESRREHLFVPTTSQTFVGLTHYLTKMPLYMEAIMNILRKVNDSFDYAAFRQQLAAQKSNPG